MSHMQMIGTMLGPPPFHSYTALICLPGRQTLLLKGVAICRLNLLITIVKLDNTFYSHVASLRQYTVFYYIKQLHKSQKLLVLMLVMSRIFFHHLSFSLHSSFSGFSKAKLPLL